MKSFTKYLLFKTKKRMEFINITEEEYSKYTSDHTSAYMALLQDPDNQELKDEKDRAKELLDSCEYTP
ncbi:MAG: hypothetical protein WCY27_02395 [archaeon]|jgi:thiamine phosphate synthase YjbQ (UPF0047 family)|nr:hypothetical protein [archaeon]MDD2477421.1 hypothetical protein [Candidatus ainarchaeum sp.]MDD3084722.1 hypothetical protein [Candidatus ainarchaeum sp.]MDD4220952.1 hypothetical protein [Candidatus ainarchaeum sp.]MDD4662478.1 hypothetical protein [Candidatus ainarchaeum sp.]